MADSPLLIADLRGGRNGVDPSTDPNFPSNQCVEALNVDFSTGPVGGTRGGSDDVALLGGTAFTLGMYSLYRHVPAGEEADAELWGVDGAGLVKRLRNGTNWANVTLDDPITGNYDKVNFVTFNGKLFIFYQSAVNRLHVYDPYLDIVRRVGINPGTTAGTASQGTAAGTLTGARYYRARYLQIAPNACVRKSEPTPAVLATPDGAHAAMKYQLPNLPGERETHWELEMATSADGPWYCIQGIDFGSPIAITSYIYEDTTTTASLTGFPASDPAGMYTLFPAMKYGITDNNRLIGTGSWSTLETHDSRIWLTPVLGSDDRGDDERWNDQADLHHRIDTSEKNGGSITSIIGPVNGIFWTMKYRQVWRHTPTNDLVTPYLSRQVSFVVGAVTHKASVLAEDVEGAPAGYFLSHRGYYRVGIDGLLYMGRDVEDVWKGKNGYSKVNLSATIVGHATLHTDEAELWVWLATGTNDAPNIRLVCSLKQATRRDKYGLRGGWRVDTGDAASAYCSAPFANTLGASMSKDLKPYIGRSNTKVYKCDSDTANTDNGVAYQSYVLTKSIVPPEMSNSLFSVNETVITALASAGYSIRQVLVGDYGIKRTHSDQALDPKKGESIVMKKFGASMISEQGAIQVQLGDIQAMSSKWDILSLLIPVSRQGSK